MKYLISMAVTAALCSSPVFADADAMTVSVKRMTLETATAIARGAVVACRELGIQIGVTVVDRDGTVQVQLRDTIAAPITVPISKMKAFTAVNFNAATSALHADDRRIHGGRYAPNADRCTG